MKVKKIPTRSILSFDISSFKQRMGPNIEIFSWARLVKYFISVEKWKVWGNTRLAAKMFET